MAPMTENLLLLAQPEKTRPMISRDIIAIRKKTPIALFDGARLGMNGTTEKPAKTTIKMSSGAVMKTNLFALVGMMSSF
jgi:hypothetical protein